MWGCHTLHYKICCFFEQDILLLIHLLLLVVLFGCVNTAIVYMCVRMHKLVICTKGRDSC